MLGISEKTKLVLSVENGQLVIKPSSLKKAGARERDIRKIVREIMDEYAPVFEKLAKI